MHRSIFDDAMPIRDRLPDQPASATAAGGIPFPGQLA
jgi:hypothetical protein